MKNKIFLHLALSAAILIGYAPISLASFSDVTTDHLNADAIEYVQTQGIVGGYPDGTYKPDQTINRAEFTKIVIEAQFDEGVINNCISDNNTQSDWTYVFFPDVPIDQWFAKYVCVAKANNIIQGYPDGTFKPAQNISFVEASKIIVITLGYPFGTDAIWYKPYVERLGEEKAIPTTINQFEKNISRGEMAEIIYRLKASVKDKPSMTYKEGALVISSVESNQPAEPQAMQYNGSVLAGNASPLLDFEQVDYETALSADKPIVLYFYANWCPICVDEVNNATYPAFNEFDAEGLVGFRVNYNDSDTDDFEESLAREFGVAYQHTKVFIKNGERVLKSPEKWDKARYLEELNNLLQ